MSKRSQFSLALSPVLALALAVSATAAPPQTKPEAARLATYQKSTGETCFALSLSPNVAARPHESADIVVLFDTSASQTGLFREDSLSALQTLLGNLSEQDRVKLVAVDLDAIELTTGFVAPNSKDLSNAIAKLQRRVPLGSTDMAKALNSAVNSFAGAAGKPRAAIYIGDGMSKANWLANGEFSALVKGLVDNRIPVSSYAIGPQRDIHLLAALANHTGGMIYVDGDDAGISEKAGAELADAAHAAVFWPTSSNLPRAIVEVYPATIPPLRSDRDTILIGMLDAQGTFQIALETEENGKPVPLTWNVVSEGSSEDLSFLPQLLDAVRDDRGLSLPTVGSAGLAEAGRVMLAGALDLSKLSAQALASGDRAGAAKLADAALKRDPGNPEALRVREAVLRRAGDAADAAAELRLVADESPAGSPSGGGGVLDRYEAGAGRFLRTVEDDRSVIGQKIQAEVEEGLAAGRTKMSTNAEAAKDDLKLLLETVERAPDLGADVRAQLRNRIESAIREAGRRAIEDAERTALAEQTKAEALARQRLIQDDQRREDKIKQLMDRFNSLMAEGNYQAAEDQVAAEVQKLNPHDPDTEAARWWARNAGNVDKMAKLRELRHAKFVDMLYQVELSHVPFPDEPPIVYPDAAKWEDLTIKRLKYRAVDLAQKGGAEEKIFKALNDTTKLEFIETPLQDVIDYLESTHHIQIELDRKALDTIGIGSDTPISKDLDGITLRSALRLMLKEHDLTYMVQDEVLLITTPEEAEANLITKVYPVGDLVLPISQQGGANPFSLGGGVQGNFGGGGGGGAGGGGGGFGGGGGGFGGGGGGFGGGGFMAVDDELKLGVKDVEPFKNVEPKQVRPQSGPGQNAMIKLSIQSGTSVADAWDQHFANHDEAPMAVRETVRVLMGDKKFDEVIALIQAALRHGQPQPWMYEALGLAMQAAGTPKPEIERTLMSAVDFSDNLDDVMIAGMYMAHIGFDERALSLFRDVSSANPRRPEPFVEGLRVAKRLDDVDGIRWACVGIIQQAWPKEHRDVFDNALRTAKATLIRLEKEQRTDEANEFLAALNQAVKRDVVVKVNWTGDADIDLLIEEPSGSLCSIRNPRSTAGGVMLGDSYSRPDQKTVNGYTEMYVCPEGFSGEYRMLLRRVWGKPTAGKVTVDIVTNEGDASKRSVIHQQIDIGEKDALVIFKLDNGRRNEPIEEAVLTNVVKGQLATAQAVLAQHLSTLESSDAARAYAVSQLRAVQDGRIPGPRFPGGVGYRPVITTLPEGTNMSATAVISADRRYVRITATPLFSSIGNVSTFNFASGGQVQAAQAGGTQAAQAQGQNQAQAQAQNQAQAQ